MNRYEVPTHRQTRLTSTTTFRRLGNRPLATGMSPAQTACLTYLVIGQATLQRGLPTARGLVSLEWNHQWQFYTTAITMAVRISQKNIFIAKQYAIFLFLQNRHRQYRFPLLTSNDHTNQSLQFRYPLIELPLQVLSAARRFHALSNAVKRWPMWRLVELSSIDRFDELLSRNWTSRLSILKAPWTRCMAELTDQEIYTRYSTATNKQYSTAHSTAQIND